MNDSHIPVKLNSCEVEELQPDPDLILLKRLQFGLTILLFILSCIGNLLTIMCVLRNRHLQKKKNVLIVSLAVADITCLVIYMINMQRTPVGDYFRTNINVDTVLVTAAVFISVMHIMFIGFERIIAITRPLHYPIIITTKTMVAMVIAVWMIPTVTIIPGFLFTLTKSGTRGITILYTAYYSLCIGSYFFLTATLSSLYGKILYDAILQANKVHELKSKAENNVNEIKRPGKKAIKMVLSILFCFAIAYFLYIIYCFLKVFGVDEQGSNYGMNCLEVIGMFFMQANSTVNVVIYAAFSQEFRRAYVKMLCFRKDTNSNDLEAVTTQSTM